MPKESKTSREIIENLHKKAGIKKTDIRPFKQSFESGTPIKNIPPNIERVEDRLKAEINALTAIFLEEIWLRALEDIKKHPYGLARKMTNNALTSSEITSALSLFENSEQVANYLIAGSKAFLQKQLFEWHRMRNKKWEAGMGWVGDDSDYKDKAYNRYVQLLMGKDEQEPVMQIQAGILTAINTIWGIIKIMPKIYEHQFKKKMPVNEFEKLARNSLPLIYALAGSHVGMFVSIERKYLKTGDSPLVDSSEASDFDQTQFNFRSNDEGLYLELRSDTLTDIEPYRKTDTVRTSCPAIYSMGPSHRNVIAEMHDWILDLAKRYYLPALQKEQRSS